jgi:hypothetical protein
MVEPSGPLRVQREHTVLEPTLGIYGVGLTCFEPDAGFWVKSIPICLGSNAAGGSSAFRKAQVWRPA